MLVLCHIVRYIYKNNTARSKDVYPQESYNNPTIKSKVSFCLSVIITAVTSPMVNSCFGSKNEYILSVLFFKIINTLQR